MGIVDEIIVATKNILSMVFVDYTELDYQYILPSNSERSLEKRYGFVAANAAFVDGSGIGFTTIDHTFKLIISDTYINQDCDTPLREVLNKQYELLQTVLKDLQKSKLALPTIGNRVMLITGLSIDEPEIIEENGIVILTANFNYRYQYRNN
jgi:hypothetical protein